MSEFCNSRRILKNIASVLTLSRHHVGNSSLTDYRITVTSDSRVQEKLIDVLEADRATVYVVFTLARAEITPRDRHLVIRTLKVRRTVSIVKRDRDLRKAHGLAAVGSAEDDVLHFSRTQSFRGYLAKHPAHGVGNIRFSASVWPHDDRDTCLVSFGVACVKYKLCLVGEGFESLHFY